MLADRHKSQSETLKALNISAQSQSETLKALNISAQGNALGLQAANVSKPCKGERSLTSYAESK